MSTSTINNRTVLPIPVAFGVKKNRQVPGLTSIAISHVKNSPITNTFVFGICGRQQARYNYKILYTGTQLLLKRQISPVFTLRNHIQLRPFNTPQAPYINMSRHRHRISLLRFAAYTIALVVMLPLFLINGRDSVKLNKTKRDIESDEALP